MAKNSVRQKLFLMERNPYFFAVDAEGQQLPYVDTVSHRLFEAPDVFDLRIINGEVDFQARHVSLANFTLYKENEVVRRLPDVGRQERWASRHSSST